jgi:hypothetical protein
MGVDAELMEVGYGQGLESWGNDLGNEVLQVFADPLEGQLCESGEENARGRRKTCCGIDPAPAVAVALASGTGVL